MERLTERDSNGTNFLVFREGCNGGPACFECEQKAIDRLAAYEDTGLEPEEVKALVQIPNDPLTLEELLKMDGEPIWVVFKGMNVNPSWYIVNTKCEEAANKNGGFVPMVYYGYTWLAYRRRSEEGEKC